MRAVLIAICIHLLAACCVAFCLKEDEVSFSYCFPLCHGDGETEVLLCWVGQFIYRCLSTSGSVWPDCIGVSSSTLSLMPGNSRVCVCVCSFFLQKNSLTVVGSVSRGWTKKDITVPLIKGKKKDLCGVFHMHHPLHVLWKRTCCPFWELTREKRV